MNGLNDAYVESVIKKAIDGTFTTRDASAKLGVTKQYVSSNYPMPSLIVF